MQHAVFASGTHRACSMNAVDLYFDKAAFPPLFLTFTLKTNTMQEEMQNMKISGIPVHDRLKSYVKRNQSCPKKAGHED